MKRKLIIGLLFLGILNANAQSLSIETSLDSNKLIIGDQTLVGYADDGSSDASIKEAVFL